MKLSACSRTKVPIVPLLLILLFLICDGMSRGETPRALPKGSLPEDTRLGPLRDLNGYFPFRPPASRMAWTERAASVRRRIRVALGLWPWPTRTPLEAVIHGRIDQGNYSVAKVYFQSRPGFFVTGNLYMPNSGQGPFPGVLCPHGHWENGRFMDSGADRVAEEIATGAERFPNGGRSPLQARCVQLARMGCVVFHYDMIGYADSQQIPQSIAHGFREQRDAMNQPHDWGLFSPQAESHLQNVMGLQAWNSIRALDFLVGLPEVDPQRLAVTGASGGGTQSFILAALDPRLRVAFPAVMVSTAMQGGCTCENASLLRIGTGNVEIAGLFAPLPLGMTAADDWTVEMPERGFPELQELYRLLGHPDNVMLKALLQYGHNYNARSRRAMYAWLHRHLDLPGNAPPPERDYPRLNREQLTVWNNNHPKPPGGPEFERRLLADWHHDASRQLHALYQNPPAYRAAVLPALEVVLGRTLDEAGSILWTPKSSRRLEGASESVGLLQNPTYGESLPAILLTPESWNGEITIWVDQRGKAGLYVASGNLRPEINILLQNGQAVLGLDLLYQGEFLRNGESHSQTRRVDNPREAAAYTLGYNNSLFSRRVHDVLSAVALARHLGGTPHQVNLAGLAGSGHWVAAARCLTGHALNRVAVVTEGFRFGNVRSIRDPDFLPGGAKYDDLPGMLAAAGPGPLWLAGEPEPSVKWLRDLAYTQPNSDLLTVDRGPTDSTATRAAEWLTRDVTMLNR